MEKVVYLLWAGADDRADWGERVHRDLGPALVALGALGVQCNIDDADVAPVQMRMTPAGEEAPAALASIWLTTAHRAQRAPFDEAVAAVAGRWGAYLVTESEPLSMAERSAPGTRSAGYVNVALLRRRDDLSTAEFLTEWLDRHTTVALQTQDTRRYLQNVVTRRLTADAPWFDGIVEERFPAAAMTDLHAMFDTAGDDAVLAERLAGMNDSTARFLDLAALTVVPTSEYVFSFVGPDQVRPR